jgi:hypothetical protein
MATGGVTPHGVWGGGLVGVGGRHETCTCPFARLLLSLLPCHWCDPHKQWPQGAMRPAQAAPTLPLLLSLLECHSKKPLPTCSSTSVYSDSGCSCWPATCTASAAAAAASPPAKAASAAAAKSSGGCAKASAAGSAGGGWAAVCWGAAAAEVWCTAVCAACNRCSRWLPVGTWRALSSMLHCTAPCRAAAVGRIVPVTVTGATGRGLGLQRGAVCMHLVPASLLLPDTIIVP